MAYLRILGEWRYRRWMEYGVAYIASAAAAYTYADLSYVLRTPNLHVSLASAAAAYTYADLSVRAHVPQIATQYSAYPAGIDLLFDVRKLYSRALSNVFEEQEWGPLEYTVLAKHYERHDQRAFAYHAHYLAHLTSSGEMDGTRPAPRL